MISNTNTTALRSKKKNRIQTPTGDNVLLHLSHQILLLRLAREREVGYLLLQSHEDGREVVVELE